MSMWLLLDALLFLHPQIIPSFFLLGFVTDKKVSWVSILTVSLFLDWILLNTKFLFLIILIIFKILQNLLNHFRLNPYFKFTCFYILFLIILNSITFHSLENLLRFPYILTYLLSNFFLFCFINYFKHS